MICRCLRSFRLLLILVATASIVVGVMCAKAPDAPQPIQSESANKTAESLREKYAALRVIDSIRARNKRTDDATHDRP